ncbi:class I SAM-dependent methyltransferase [Actinokineospora terrae]|uniref:Cyclopropane-fatty-acyl-phospholipid synthase n=1 Tax=Actinokineospora terrae TaxID=155974 RepID=A0A1H9XSY1_9PSEU|nr:class I SAM-dependent methyltransferase [Actinokineospora terrae]SES49285.1 cyclopropane-fatty-acyl-phospholipid synthase [Actinokineospora terrae]
MAVADTNVHYDLDPEIFGLYLDPMRKYSAGLYTSPEDTLEQAQRTKLRFVAERVNLGPGKRLLDIGSGWGSLILFMAQEFGARTVGISPAPNQHAYIHELVRERGLEDLVSTRVGHIEELEIEPRSFDAVTMLGSIVHMPDLGAAFARAHAALRTKGMLYVSESCYRNAAKRAEFGELDSSAFVRDAIFGWGDMRPLSELVRGAEDAGFSVVAVDDLTDHYHRTIEDWLANVARSAERLDEIEAGLADKLTRYLRTANAGWGFTTKHYALTCAKRR